MDAKGRIALPSALRRALEQAGVTSLVIAHDGEALLVRDPESWVEKVEKRVVDQDMFDPTVRDFAIGVASTANDVEIDAQGRILIPTSLRNLASLSKDIVVVSMLDYAMIWDKALYDKRRQEAQGRRTVNPQMPGGRAP